MNIGHFFFNHSSQRNVRELAERQPRSLRRARRHRGDARREREQLTERV